MKKKTLCVLVSVAVLFLIGIAALSLSTHRNVSTEQPSSLSSQTSSATKKEVLKSNRLQVTQMDEPVFLGQDGQSSGKIVYAFSLRTPMEHAEHISLIPGNSDIKFIEYITLTEEESLRTLETDFETNRIYRKSPSTSLSPVGSISHNATKWLKNPVEKAFKNGEDLKFFLEIPVTISSEKNTRAKGDDVLWTAGEFSVFALLTGEDGQQYLQEIVLDLEPKTTETNIAVFDRDLQDLEKIEVKPQPVTKELYNYRRIYSSMDKVEKTYSCRYFDPESQTVLKGQLKLTSTTKMGDAIHAYYEGTVAGVKEGCMFI